MIIYKYTNLINGKIYIGMTIRKLKVRHWAHMGTVNDGTHFHNALKKYGENNFALEIIDQAKDFEELKEKEKQWILFYNSNNPKIGYNITNGGEGTLGLKHTQEAKDKVSVANKGKNHPLYGKHRSQEIKNKISKANFGRIRTQETKNKISLIKTGIKASQETKNKMSKSHIGKNLGSNNGKAKQIICKNTNEIFSCISDASRKYNINHSHISECCKGKIKSAGKHPKTKEKMVWEYCLK